MHRTADIAAGTGKLRTREASDIPVGAVALATLAIMLRTVGLVVDPHAPLTGGGRNDLPYWQAPHPVAECPKGNSTC